MKAKSVERLAKYLKWLPADKDVFLRPSFDLDESAVAAADAMVDWEGRGVDLPRATSEPSLLADYVQGKRLRDFNIAQYKEGIREGTLFPHELVGVGEFETLDDVLAVVGGFAANAAPVDDLDFPINRMLKLTR